MSARGARTGAGQGPGGRRRRLLGAAVPVAVICAAVVLGPRWNTDADDRAAASGASGASASPTSSAGPAATGTFTVARGGPDGSGGRGSKAYRVEVEDGSGVDPDGAAAEIAGILAAPRGWAHHGEHRFHRVSSGPAGSSSASPPRRPPTPSAGRAASTPTARSTAGSAPTSWSI
ncbi:hypothetical protein ACFV97_10320 [Streptomyces sp. NPDC059913]|uniref:hypothetical protein n=1 Tax=unclassified Streptomyces TaxID=2593676 RepID=UPI003654BE9E